jgi:hypothetical protein
MCFEITPKCSNTLNLGYQTLNFLQCPSSVIFSVKSCQNLQNTHFFCYKKIKLQRFKGLFLTIGLAGRPEPNRQFVNFASPTYICPPLKCTIGIHFDLID